MLRPAGLLVALTGSAIALSGWLQVWYLKNQSTGEISRETDSAEISDLRDQLLSLEQENAVLRSLAQGGGDIPVPEDLIAFVETTLDLEFRSTPVVKLSTEEGIIDAALDELANIYGENGLSEREKVWSHIGLIPPEQALRGQFQAIATTGARGAISADGLVMAADFDLENVRDASALATLLGRRLVEEHMGPPPVDASDDEHWARLALRDGLAAKVTAAYRARQARMLGTLPSSPASQEAAALLESLPLFVQLVASFPARHGLFYVESSGSDAKSLTSSPPTSSAQVMSGDKAVGDGSLGQLGLLGLLGQSMEPAQAQELARSWVRDSLVYDKFSSKWEITVSSSEAAGQIAQAAKETLGALFPRDEQADLPPFMRRSWQVRQEEALITIENKADAS